MRDFNPYPGVHNKILNKTRIIRKFIWFKKLKRKQKILEDAYILQKCLKNEYGIGLQNPPKNYLDWYDIEFTSKPTLFLKCCCNNELVTSGSFISEDDNSTWKFVCTDCREESHWTLALAPFPIRINPTIFLKTTRIQA